MLYTMTECDFILSQLDRSNLTEWELGFIRSVTALRETGAGLSNKQVETLSRIWEKQS